MTRQFKQQACVVLCLLITAGVSPHAFATPDSPTEASALAAEQEVARALLANDADAVGKLLADDWAVVSAHGGVADKAGFLGVIKSGDFTRKTMDLSDFRVKLYGNTAVVTSQLKTSGMFFGKPFSVTERQTDVLIWRDGRWKSVLTHETEIREK